MAEGPRGWGRPLHEHVLDAAGVRRGTTLLDLGCGTGVFARAAADRGAHVIGIDLDRAAVARAAAEVPSGAFRVGDVHEPGGPDAVFDVVAAVQLIAHVTNPVRVLREAARVVRSGGRVAVTVWGREAKCDMRAFGEALAPWLPPRTGPRAGPPPVTDPDRLRRLASLSRLAVQALDEIVCPFDYPDADAVLEPLYTSAMGRHVLARVGSGVVRDAVLQRLEPMRTPGGGYRLDNLFRVLIARPA